jgi:hypothetical protein
MNKNILNVHLLSPNEYHKVLKSCKVENAYELKGNAKALFRIGEFNGYEYNESYWMSGQYGEDDSIVAINYVINNKDNPGGIGGSVLSNNISNGEGCKGVRPVVCISNEQSLVVVK